MTTRDAKWLADWEAQMDLKRIERFGVSLMNNTKWHEVWALITEMRLRVYCASTDFDEAAGWDANRLAGPIPASEIHSKGLVDPDVFGPLRYKQILWVRVPRIPGNDMDGFLERLKALGQLPLHLTSDYLEIRGYKEVPGALIPHISRAQRLRGRSE